VANCTDQQEIMALNWKASHILLAACTRWQV